MGGASWKKDGVPLRGVLAVPPIKPPNDENIFDKNWLNVWKIWDHLLRDEMEEWRLAERRFPKHIGTKAAHLLLPMRSG